jgi:hypothetical protein
MSSSIPWFALATSALLAAQTVEAQAPLPTSPTASRSASIPVDQLGSIAGAKYQGDGLSVIATPEGARLRCVFQRLEGEATPEGLLLTSTSSNATNDSFRVVAMKVGRETAQQPPAIQTPVSDIHLPGAGKVCVDDQLVRFSRNGLTEEYSVSLDGLRQDFMVQQPPHQSPMGELVVKLAVTGAKVEAAAYGARLVLENSGRRIAYSRMRVTDATSRELPARIDVTANRHSDALAIPANWTVNSSWATSNGTNYMNMANPTGNLFFRLVK